MTKIQWTNQTWNPIIGCSKVSEGCQNCYAEKMARRLSGIAMSKADEDPFRIEGIGRYPFALNSNGKWNGKTYFDKEEIMKPFKWKKSRLIFVCSMGDLFHESIPFEWIDEVIDVIRWTKQHTYQILTKRPARMAEYFRNHVPEKYMMENGTVLDNLWMGVTAENQERANERIPILVTIPAAKIFVSCEPLLSSIDFEEIPTTRIEGRDNKHLFTLRKINHIDWVIVGAESGDRRRPMEEYWVLDLKNQCEASGIPFFFKQKYVGNKKFSMPILDGKVYDQIPAR